MNKKFVFFSILLSIGMLFLVSSLIDPRPTLMLSTRQGNNVQEVSFSLQVTEAPPVIPTIVIPVPTIIVNPPPGSTGFLGLAPLTILIFVLVGAIILIALVAVLKR